MAKSLKFICQNIQIRIVYQKLKLFKLYTFRIYIFLFKEEGISSAFFECYRADSIMHILSVNCLGIHSEELIEMSAS